jgi:hypothetical protein
MVMRNTYTEDEKERGRNRTRARRVRQKAVIKEWEVEINNKSCQNNWITVNHKYL